MSYSTCLIHCELWPCLKSRNRKYVSLDTIIYAAKLLQKYLLNIQKCITYIAYILKVKGVLEFVFVSFHSFVVSYIHSQSASKSDAVIK